MERFVEHERVIVRPTSDGDVVLGDFLRGLLSDAARVRCGLVRVNDNILVDRNLLHHRLRLCRLSLSDQNIKLLHGNGQQFLRLVLGGEIFGRAT